MVELKSLTLSNGEAYEKKYLQNFDEGEKRNKFRTLNEPPPSIQSFLQIALLDTCYMVSYSPQYGGGIQGRYRGSPH